MMRLAQLGLLVGLFTVVGCASAESGDPTSGAAASAAELAKKSENARPLSAADQASLSKGVGAGGGGAATIRKKGSL